MTPDEDPSTVATRAAIMSHLDAFNRHSTDALIAGFAAGAVWATGRDTAAGHDELRSLFDAGLWELAPSLTVRTILARGAHAAVELREDLTFDGARRTWNIAAFFTVEDGLIVSAKIYREGSADLN